MRGLVGGSSFLGGMFLAVAVALAPAKAEACFPPPTRVVWTIPSGGQIVAADSVILVGVDGAGASLRFALTDSFGATVHVSSTRLDEPGGFEGVFILRPLQPLPAGEYSLHVVHDSADGFDGFRQSAGITNERISFVVEGGDPPTRPAEGRVELEWYRESYVNQLFGFCVQGDEFHTVVIQPAEGALYFKVELFREGRSRPTEFLIRAAGSNPVQSRFPYSNLSRVRVTAMRPNGTELAVGERQSAGKCFTCDNSQSEPDAECRVDWSEVPGCSPGITRRPGDYTPPAVQKPAPPQERPNTDGSDKDTRK